MEIETPQGPVRWAMPEALREAIRGEIHRAVIDIENDRLVLTLVDGAEATVELGVTTGEIADALAGRRVVYLDQNRWSAMAAWRHGHKPIDESEASAAARLAELVTDQQIVLPMSAGHLIETGPCSMSAGRSMRRPCWSTAVDGRCAIRSRFARKS